MLLISIIIPAYNVETYLRVCLDSIVKQPFDNYEVILVDDGSTDGTAGICDEYGERFAQLKIIHKINGGVSSARNCGLNAANGRWIWFVDADDWVSNNSLQLLYGALSSHDTDIIFFGLDCVGDNFTQHRHSKEICNMDKSTFLLSVMCYNHQAILYKRDVIEDNDIRFTKGIKMAEDLEFQYKYLCFCQKPISISDCLYVYRYRENSATNNPSTYKNNMNDCIKVTRNLLHFVNELSIPEQLWLSLRIRTLLKSGLQSAEHLAAKDRRCLKEELRDVLDGFKNIGYYSVEDCTLRLARTNLNFYFLCLRLFYRLKGIK